jgi:hypothetical protein
MASTIFGAKGFRAFVWHQSELPGRYTIMVWDWEKDDLVQNDLFLVELMRPGSDWVELTEEQFNRHIQWLKAGRPKPVPDWVW